MKLKTSFFLPTRKGSLRVKNKNTRKFSNYSGGLLELKLHQLLESKLIDEIILSTNDEHSIKIASLLDPGLSKIRIDARPDELCLDSTPLKKLIEHAGHIATNEHILWGHVTTPFVSSSDYDKIITQYQLAIQMGHDSLIGVKDFQNFLIDSENGKLINVKAEQNNWPRTQDLKILYEVNHTVFFAPKNTFIKTGDRIGVNPYFYRMNKIQSFDIDWEEDFLIAEAINEKLFKI